MERGRGRGTLGSVERRIVVHGTPVSIVIAGGGVAALEAALTLRELAGDRVTVEMVAPEPRFWYRPLAVVEPFGLGEAVHLDLSALASSAGATLTQGTVVSVDAARHVVHTYADVAIPYDSLLIACGAVPKPVVRGALTFRGPADTAKVAELLTEIERRDRPAGRLRRALGGRMGASHLRARAADSPSCGCPRHIGRRDNPRHAGGCTAAAVRRRGERNGCASPRRARRDSAHEVLSARGLER